MIDIGGGWEDVVDIRWGDWLEWRRRRRSVIGWEVGEVEISRVWLEIRGGVDEEECLDKKIRVFV